MLAFFLFCHGRKPEDKRNKQAALDWLKAEEGEFEEVCELAGLDFKKTRARLLELAMSNEEILDFRCLKKALLGNRNCEPRSKYLPRVRRNERAKKGQPRKN